MGCSAHTAGPDQQGQQIPCEQKIRQRLIVLPSTGRCHRSSVQQAIACKMRHAPCKMQDATCTMQRLNIIHHAIHSLRHGNCDMRQGDAQHATCDAQYATCSMRHCSDAHPYRKRSSHCSASASGKSAAAGLEQAEDGGGVCCTLRQACCVLWRAFMPPVEERLRRAQWASQPLDSPRATHACTEGT